MSSQSYEDSIAFTKNVIDDIRAQIEAAKTKLNSHIGEIGLPHPNATASSPGYMSPQTYTDIYTTIPNLAVDLDAARVANEIPSGTTCWYYGYPEDLPEGWSLTSANPLNKLYPITTQENGGSLRGITSSDEIPGMQESVTGKESSGARLTTVALFSIRKD